MGQDLCTVEWDRAQQKLTFNRNDDYWGEKPKIAKAIDEWSTRRAMLNQEMPTRYIPSQYLEQVIDMPG